MHDLNLAIEQMLIERVLPYERKARMHSDVQVTTTQRVEVQP